MFFLKIALIAVSFTMTACATTQTPSLQTATSTQREEVCKKESEMIAFQGIKTCALTDEELKTIGRGYFTNE